MDTIEGSEDVGIATAELVAPGTGMAAAAIGAAGGAVYGYHQTSQQLAKAKAQSGQQEK